MVTGLFIILSLNLFFIQSILTSLFLIFGLFLFCFFLYQPKLGLFLIILARPSIDKFSEKITINVANNATFNSAAIFGLLVIFLLSIFIVKNKKNLPTLPLKKSWLFFLIISTLSIFWTIDKTASVYEIIRLVSIFLIFCSFYIISKKEKSPYLIIYAIIFSSLIPFVTATYQLITKSGLGGTSGIESRLFGTFSHPNPFASFVLIVLAVSLFLIFRKNKTKNKWLLYLLVSWGVILLIQTFSRGAWFAFMIFVIILSLFKSPRSILIVGIFFLVLFFASPMIQDRVEDIYNPPADSSIRWRFAQWERMYKIFEKNPVIGQGIGTETIVHEKEYGFYAGNPYTHNDFLRIALETGISGFVIYSFLIFSTLTILFINYYQSKNTPLEILNLFIFALFLAMISFSLTNNTLRETVTQWNLWALVGSVLAISNKSKTRSRISSN